MRCRGGCAGHAVAADEVYTGAVRVTLWLRMRCTGGGCAGDAVAPPPPGELPLGGHTPINKGQRAARLTQYTHLPPEQHARLLVPPQGARERAHPLHLHVQPGEDRAHPPRWGPGPGRVRPEQLQQPPPPSPHQAPEYEWRSGERHDEPQAGNAKERLALHWAEIEKQDQYLRERQRHRFHIIPDGNCLYRAVAKAVYGDQGLHAELRERTVHHVSDHLDTFNLIVEGDVGEFLIGAAQEGAWAGYPELLAMSQMLDVDIHLTTGGRPECPTVSTMVHHLGPQGPARPAIWISWLSNGHYDAVFEQPLPNPEYELWYQQHQAQRQRDQELARSMAMCLSKMYIEQNS
uniref:OTU domain-containing protein 1 n=1 Tax=Leptobrachium leishanense TaxID=445787 RepID=A0A8C5N2L3_9ANUR